MAPALAPAWLGLAEVRERQERLEEALGLARRAQELAPDEPAVHRIAGRLLARLGADEAARGALARVRELAPSEPDSYLLEALLLRRRGAADEAAELLASGIAQGSESAALHRELVLTLLAAGRPAEAAAAAETALASHPADPGLQMATGLALAALPARRDEAGAWLERALAGGVEQPQRAQLELGTLLLESDRAAKAVQHLEAAALGLAGEPTVWYRLALARQANGDADGAAVALDRFRQLSRERDAADHESKRLGAALNEAQALAAASRLDEALARVREVVAAAPGEPRARALEGKVLYSLGHREEALASIRAARAAAPAAVEYAYLEGLFLAELERADEAEAALRRALDLDPGLAEAWERLGRLALAGGRPAEAASRFEMALSLGAEGPALRLFYAEALERAGRVAESREQMDAYRRLRQP